MTSPPRGGAGGDRADGSLGNAPAVPAWRTGLPTYTGSLIGVREVRPDDAVALYEALATKEVTRFISPPPQTVSGFSEFIARCQDQRAQGKYACFVVVPRGSDAPIGLFHVRSLDPWFAAAEWGFAIAPEFWGTGVFADAARLVANFTFTTLGSHRLEARVAVSNERANGALRKLGAGMEALLRHSLQRPGEQLDQALWTIVADEWPPDRRSASADTVH